MANSQSSSNLIAQALVDFNPPNVLPDGGEPYYRINRGFKPTVPVFNPRTIKRGPNPHGDFILVPDDLNGLSPEDVTVTITTKFIDDPIEGPPGIIALWNADIVDTSLPGPGIKPSYAIRVYTFLSGGAYAGPTLEDVPFWIHVNGVYRDVSLEFALDNRPLGV
jgi:hypothetical protein